MRIKKEKITLEITWYDINFFSNDNKNIKPNYNIIIYNTKSNSLYNKMKTVPTKSEHLYVSCLPPIGSSIFLSSKQNLGTKIIQRCVQKPLIFFKRETELQQTLIRLG